MDSARLLELQAQVNYSRLAQNPYPGRVIVAGLDPSGMFLVMLYAIMGRSPNSQNRVFGDDEHGRVFTEAADPAKVEDPSLIIYNAMIEGDGYCIVSNGDQTDTVFESTATVLADALNGRTYEPDAPNFTQRITAMFMWGGGDYSLQMSILRKSRFDDSVEAAHYHYRKLAPGLGYFISTYSGDGNPLPPFRGEPLLMPIAGVGRDAAWQLHDALNPEYFVAIAAKSINMKTGESHVYLINKYDKVGG